VNQRAIKLTNKKYLLFMSTSAFLQTMLANLLPIPLMEVRANMIFCLPSTLVFSTRRMCWNSSFATRACNIRKKRFSYRLRILQKLNFFHQRRAVRGAMRWARTIFAADVSLESDGRRRCYRCWLTEDLKL